MRQREAPRPPGGAAGPQLGTAGHSWMRGGRSWGTRRSWDRSGSGQRCGGVWHRRGERAPPGVAQLELGHSWSPGTAGVAAAQLVAAGYVRPMQVRVLVAAASTAGAHLGGSRAGSYGTAGRTYSWHMHIWRCTHLRGPRAQVTSAGSQNPLQLLRAWVYFFRDPEVVSGLCSFRLWLR